VSNLFDSELKQVEQEVVDAKNSFAYFEAKMKEARKQWEDSLVKQNQLLSLKQNCKKIQADLKVAIVAAQRLSCLLELKEEIDRLFECNQSNLSTSDSTPEVPRSIRKALHRQTIVVDENIFDQPKTKIWTLKYVSMDFLDRTPKLNIGLYEKHVVNGWEIEHDNGKYLLRWDGEAWKDFDKEWSQSM
jgi:hypothetical protein